MALPDGVALDDALPLGVALPDGVALLLGVALPDGDGTGPGPVGPGVRVVTGRDGLPDGPGVLPEGLGDGLSVGGTSGTTLMNTDPSCVSSLPTAVNSG